VGATVLLAFEVEARNAAEDFQPLCGVAADFDLRLDRPKCVERLVEEIAHDARLGCVAGGANVVDGEVVVDAEVAFDEASHLPGLSGAIVALEEEDVATAGGAAVTLAMALLIGMGQRRTDCSTESRGVIRLGSPDTVRQTLVFHAASCVPTE